MKIADINKKKTVYEIIFVLSAIMIGFTTLYFPTSMRDNNHILAIVLGIIWGASFISLFISSLLFSRLKKYFKNNFIVDKFRNEFPTLVFDAKKGIEADEIYENFILQPSTKYKTEDYLRGNILGHAFESADVHIQQVVSSGKSVHYVTTFQGRVYKISMNKPFPKAVYLMPKKYNWMILKQHFKTYQVESIEFSKNYTMYTNDHHEALKIIKPVLIEKLLAFEHDIKKITIGFVDEYVYLSADTRIDNFDIRLFKPIDEAIEEQIKRELNLTKDIIELIT